MRKGHSGFLKNAKLATRLSIILGVCIALIFILMNAVSLTQTGSFVSSTIDREFFEISSKNVLKIQNVVSLCESVSQNIIYTVEEMYGKSDDLDLTAENAVIYNSEIYDVPVSESRIDAEISVVNALCAAVATDKDIVGAGIMFEPYKFSKDIKIYAPYISEDNVASEKFDQIPYDVFSNREYYTAPRDSKSLHFTDAYVDSFGNNVYTVSMPIYVDNEFKGVFIIDVISDLFSMLDEKNDNFPSLSVNIVTQDSTILYDSSVKENINKKITEIIDSKGSAAITSKIAENQSFRISTGSGKTSTVRYFTPLKVGNTQWWIQTSVLSKEYNAVITFMVRLMVAISVALLVVLIAVIVSVVKKALKPMGGLVSAAEKIGSGNLDINVASLYNDEIGTLADVFNQMAANFKLIINDISNLTEQMAGGNFAITSTCEDSYVGDFNKIIIAIKDIIKSLNETLSQINISASEVNGGADQVSSAAQSLSQGATEQASSVEELSATMVEITDKIKKNAEMANMASSLSKEAGNEVVMSNQKMQKLIDAMEDISGKSNEVEKIVKTIDDIAFQTNILALNAAVEAARAGSAGKGFAVVADEVRNLAQKSAEAAKNTTNLISATIVAVENGVGLTKETAESLEIVVNKASQVDGYIGDISLASQEQADSVAQVSMGIDQISSVVQTNSATAEESAAAAEELSSQAAMLNQLVEQFTLNDSVVQ